MISLVPTGVTAWTKEASRRIVRDAESEDHPVRNVWGYASWPDHNNRRCVDFMVYNHVDGAWLAEYLVRYRVQLRLRFLIWNGRVWRSYRHGLTPAGRWSRYRGKNPHTDHCHAEFAL